jgi:hypothetical protein
VFSLGVRRRLQPVRFGFGAACIAVPLMFDLWWLAIPMTLFGLWLLLISLGQQLEVLTTAGTRHRAPVCFNHQLDGELYAHAVMRMADEPREGSVRAI